MFHVCFTRSVIGFSVNSFQATGWLQGLQGFTRLLIVFVLVYKLVMLFYNILFNTGYKDYVFYCYKLLQVLCRLQWPALLEVSAGQAYHNLLRKRTDCKYLSNTCNNLGNNL